MKENADQIDIIACFMLWDLQYVASRSKLDQNQQLDNFCGLCFNAFIVVIEQIFTFWVGNTMKFFTSEKEIFL